MRACRFMAAALVMLAAMFASGGARAHATLVGSEPKDGAVLATAPTGFRLTFNEPVAVTALKLVGAGGATALALPQAGGAEVRIAAPAGPARGSYALSYRVVSEDGHPVSGSIAFSIGAPDAARAASADDPDRGLQLAIWAARLALYVGLLFGAGGAFARAFLASGGTAGRRAAAACATVGLVAAPVSLALLGADLAGSPLADAFAPASWGPAIATSYGWTAGLAAVSLILALASLGLRDLTAKALAMAALLGVGLALAASGHASAASPQAAMRPAVFAHAVAAAFWLGALPCLLIGLATNAPAADRSLKRFARLAPLAVLALAVSGVLLAIRQTGTVDALWTTDYGRVLAAKLALVALLLALAALNRWRWTRPAMQGDRAAAGRLRRSIAIEIVVGALILGVVALWRFTPPPRALAEEAVEAPFVHIHARQAQADVTLEAGRSGRAGLSIVVATSDSGPLDARELTVMLSNEAAGVEPIRRAAAKQADGLWRVDDLALPVAGRWTVRLDLLISDFDMERLEGELDVGGSPPAASRPVTRP